MASCFPFDQELQLRTRERLGKFPVHREDQAGRRQAAVALVMIPDQNLEANIVLTRRAQGLRRHSGQWALPGGRIDPGETISQAARREVQEEIGLDLAAADELGRLDTHLTRSGFTITPLVFWCCGTVELRPDPTEVAAAYRIPLADLARSEALQTITWDSDRLLPVMTLASIDDTVFCPTAAILHQFAEVVAHDRPTRVAHFEAPRFAWS